jgi:beta-glucosidase/6-phospho-beta-glucosidase/beta-galactosidase
VGAGVHPAAGIVCVDFANQRRILKDSAKWYHGVIAANGI